MRQSCFARPRSSGNCRTTNWTRSGRAPRSTTSPAARYWSGRARRRTRSISWSRAGSKSGSKARTSPINEVGVGEPIGETGFFSGATRNATIVAARDSVVLELDRASFDEVARQVPAIHQTLLRALARRLAEGSLRIAPERRGIAARTVAVIAGGASRSRLHSSSGSTASSAAAARAACSTAHYLGHHFPAARPTTRRCRTGSTPSNTNTS